MELGEVVAHARERLGMEIQAVELVRARPAGSRLPEVWSLLTECGSFWLVEHGGLVEIFRAAFGRQPATVAARRFLELHPPGRPRPATSPLGEYDCRRCGAQVTPQRRRRMIERQLCARCYNAERERERYDDPQYRARHLATKRAHYRAARHGSGA